MLSLPLNLPQIRRAYFVSVWHSCIIINYIFPDLTANMQYYEQQNDHCVEEHWNMENL